MTELESLDRTDYIILADLREMYSRVDPAPANLTERIKFALTVQALQAEVAELTSTELALTRGQPEPDETSTVTFSTEAMSIMLTLSASGASTARVDGWLTCGRADVELTVGDGKVLHAVADEGGRFVFDDVPPGQARLLVRGHDGSSRPVITPAFTI